MTKTDAQLQQDVTAELNWQPSVHSENIGVEVKDGVVTLAGHVQSYAEKRNAEMAAQSVAGVKALAVELVITLPGPNKRTDADIASSAENVLGWLAPVAAGTVEVMVESGWITLSGEVDRDYKRQAAVSALNGLVGVRGITNNIALKEAVSPASVKSDIEAALRRRTLDDMQNIQVDVRGGDITLSGSVHSWSERELARQAAWGTTGVQNVVDNLSISY